MNCAASHTRTVLVVEDDYSIRETMREALESEGYDVVTAVNGRDGLEKLRHIPKQRSLVLLDLLMPIMNGREFLDAVLADTSLATTPVLVLSATADAKSTAGAVAYLRKPPDLDVLLELVARHIASA